MMIRQAMRDDAPAIAAIINRLVHETSVTFASEPKRDDDIADAIAEARGAYHVAEEDGHVLGYASYGAFRGGTGYARTQEHSIAIAPQAFGKGIGRTLMTAIEDHARTADVHSLIAGVSGENEDGVRFHAAMGFKKVAVLPEVGFKFGRWMDLILMQKFL